MVQTLKPQRLLQVIDGAGRVFARLGYKRALMSDIAAEAGVALGTLYRYAHTKEELFELALRRGFGGRPQELWTSTRSSLGFEESVYQFVREQLAEHGRLPALEAALSQPAPEDALDELTLIAGELYDIQDRFHLGIRMLDRSSWEWPQLSTLFVDELRGPLLRKLTRYLELRCGVGALRPARDVAVGARTIIELCATLAMHRRYTPGGDYASDEMARATALHFVRAAFDPGTVSEAGGAIS
jgi:AcrR family transcriptional regulator